MNILSVIGTRPQYIKVKAIYDYCRQQQINHYILDTQQHYSDNVSASIIRDLNLTIDYALTLQPGKEIDFVSDFCIYCGKPFITNLENSPENLDINHKNITDGEIE